MKSGPGFKVFVHLLGDLQREYLGRRIDLLIKFVWSDQSTVTAFCHTTDSVLAFVFDDIRLNNLDGSGKMEWGVLNNLEPEASPTSLVEPREDCLREVELERQPQLLPV